MARQTSTRWVITAKLTTTEALHIGGGGTAGLDHVPFRDGGGRHTIPGTAIAGVLRSEFGSNPDLSHLFGDASGVGASRFVVDDVHLETVGEEIRDGVGIDRRTGSAADGFKFDRVVVRPGATGGFRAHIDLPKQPDADAPAASSSDTLAEELHRILAAGGLRIGAATTRGLGGFELSKLQVQSYDLTSPEDVLALATGNKGEEVEAAQQPGAAVRQPISLMIVWQPVLPVAVMSGFPGNAVDHWPLTTVINEKVHLLIPGSSIKGALRSRLEHLIRIAAGKEIPEDFLDQLRNTGPVQDLFGEAPGWKVCNGSTTWSAGRSGTLVFHDCTANLGIAPGKWEELRSLAGTDDTTKVKEVAAALAAAKLQFLRPSQHVAIDRWRSGAADSKLFSRIEPVPCEQLEWSPIRIDFRIDRLEESKRPAAVAAIGLLFEELADGAIALGAEVNRGMGSMRATRITIPGDLPARLSGNTPDSSTDAGAELTWPTEPSGASPLGWLEAALGDDLWRSVKIAWGTSLKSLNGTGSGADTANGQNP